MRNACFARPVLLKQKLANKPCLLLLSWTAKIIKIVLLNGHKREPLNAGEYVGGLPVNLAEETSILHALVPESQLFSEKERERKSIAEPITAWFSISAFHHLKTIICSISVQEGREIQKGDKMLICLLDFCPSCFALMCHSTETHNFNITRVRRTHKGGH